LGVVGELALHTHDHKRSDDCERTAEEAQSAAPFAGSESHRRQGR